MFKFSHVISAPFVDRLNREYSLGGWWKAIADDRELFVAIRDGYLNVYWKGNSLLKLRLEGGELIGETHYKYLLRPEVETQTYVRIENGQTKLAAPANLFMPDISDLGALKSAADVYAGDEKKGVHKVVKKNPNVIDVEIAFSTEHEKTGRLTAKRIDFSALKIAPSGPEIVFFEAKLFTNNELRAKGEVAPKVFSQLDQYRKFLSDPLNTASLISSYRQTCGNLVALDGVCNRYGPMLEVMKEIAANKVDLKINSVVRLVVFGFDHDQSKGDVWAPHSEKLLHKLGENLLINGDAAKITRGISSPAG